MKQETEELRTWLSEARAQIDEIQQESEQYKVFLKSNYLFELINFNIRGISTLPSRKQLSDRDNTQHHL